MSSDTTDKSDAQKKTKHLQSSSSPQKAQSKVST